MKYKVGDKAWIEFSNSKDGAGALQCEIAAIDQVTPPKYRVRYVAPGTQTPTHQVVPAEYLFDNPASAHAATGKTFGAIADSFKKPGTTFRDAYEKQDTERKK